jgi:hypothetical protein
MLTSPTVPQAPPDITQRAIVFAINEWNDPRRRRSVRSECDDARNPFASHPACEHILDVYHEGRWRVVVSAQRLSPRERLSVRASYPTYVPPDDDQIYTKGRFLKYVLKAPIILLTGKI